VTDLLELLKTRRNARAKSEAALAEALKRAARPQKGAKGRKGKAVQGEVLPAPSGPSEGQPEAAAEEVRPEPVQRPVPQIVVVRAPVEGEPVRRSDVLAVPRLANTGRPLEEWKGWLRSIVDTDRTRAAIEMVLSDPDHPAFAKVLTWAEERGWGKEKQALDARLQLEVVRRDEAGR
jgi:hypothetical protein